MPTIIERIAAAEADAESIRHNARESARTTVALAEDEAASSLRIAREEAKAGLALASAMAEKEALGESARLTNAGRMKADVILSGAAKKLDSAVDCIISFIKE